MENTYTSAEKLLRDKMNELTENVDCLDTITARVFPTLPAGAEDDEYIITDLEVVTGRSRKGSFLKWAAIAATIVLCIFFVPKSGAVKRFFYNMGAPSDRSFRRITSAVERMAADGDYRYIDVPLSRYAAEDILVTPLFSCPFEDTGRENVNVRIYIRQENDSVDTAEVYAVEYAGNYTPDSIIAAAEPVCTFSDEELSALDEQFRDDSAYKAAGEVNDAEGLASTGSVCYVRDGGKAVPANVELLYGSDNDGSFYDIYVSSGDKKLELPAREKMWKASVYANGTSAFPEESGSRYERRELFTQSSDISSERSGVYVFEDNSIAASSLGKEVKASFKGSSSASVAEVPLDRALASRMRLFLPDSGTGNIVVSCGNDWHYEVPQSKTAEAESLAKEQAEIEKNIKAAKDAAEQNKSN